MDWHTSATTTSVLGALKRGLALLSAEFSIHVCGGRGKYSPLPRPNYWRWRSEPVSN
jgi:hypothetical protein